MTPQEIKRVDEMCDRLKEGRDLYDQWEIGLLSWGELDDLLPKLAAENKELRETADRRLALIEDNIVGLDAIDAMQDILMQKLGVAERALRLCNRATSGNCGSAWWLAQAAAELEKEKA